MCPFASCCVFAKKTGKVLTLHVGIQHILLRDQALLSFKMSLKCDSRY